MNIKLWAVVKHIYLFYLLSFIMAQQDNKHINKNAMEYIKEDKVIKNHGLYMYVMNCLK